MITLITGAPGAGKSLLCVQSFIKAAAESGRPVYVDGVPDLVFSHETLPSIDAWTKRVPDASRQSGEKLLFDFPDGALIVVDEAQSIFRQRPVGAKVPDAVAAFETHRHQGLDFILMTQGPGLIDPNIRKLVGRHIHLRDLGILGRRMYEWPECANPEQFRQAPVQGRFKPDPKAFRWYKSASVHVKPKRGVPKGVALLALAVPVLIGLAWMGYSSVSGKVEAAKAPAAVKAAAVPGQIGAAVEPGLLARMEADKLLVEFVPRVRARPETAPAFDQVRQVKVMPVVVGCMAVRDRCKCFTQQGTDAGLSVGECRAWLDRPPFNPYQNAQEFEHQPKEVIAEKPKAADSDRLSNRPAL